MDAYESREKWVLVNGERKKEMLVKVERGGCSSKEREINACGSRETNACVCMVFSSAHRMMSPTGTVGLLTSVNLV